MFEWCNWSNTSFNTDHNGLILSTEFSCDCFVVFSVFFLLLATDETFRSNIFSSRFERKLGNWHYKAGSYPVDMRWFLLEKIGYLSSIITVFCIV